MIEIGFTGTRQGMTIAQHTALAKIMLCYYKMSGEFRWHHGVCVGSDKQCHDLAEVFDFKIWDHPPENTKFGADCKNFQEISTPKPYIARNHDIVDATDILIATPLQLNEITRSGTWATVRYAKAFGKRVVVIDPFGETHV